MTTAIQNHIQNILAAINHGALGKTDIAVAVSGGADSMALLHMLAQLPSRNGAVLHALTVDHGLRAEAANEAQMVADYIDQHLKNVRHHILRWEGDKPQTRLQEGARNARYQLMADKCGALGASALCVAHHQDDQAETMLMRLAAGSGLNGLGGMRPVSYMRGLTIVRPLLSVPKADLVAYCDAHNVPYINDPSNKNEAFTRVRLRGSMDVLAAEGLTPKRLSTTAQRLARASEALAMYADEFWRSSAVEAADDEIKISLQSYRKAPEETALRIFIKSVETLGKRANYLPRMEKMEAILSDLRASAPFRKRTLAGLIIERSDRRGEIKIMPE